MSIANQCPMVGGNAVFKARSLYWMIDDSYHFDDQLLCLPHGIIVRSVTEQAANVVSIIPNPANHEATLVVAEGMEEPVVFILFNTVGAEVMKHIVPSNTTRFAFSTATLASALYYYRVWSPSGLVGDGKLSVIR